MPLLEDAFLALTDVNAALNEDGRIGCHLFLSTPPTRLRRESWLRVVVDQAVANRLIDCARISLTKLEDRLAEGRELSEFDFDAMAEGNVGVLRVADMPAIADWLGDVPPDDWAVRFDGDENALGRARFYATRINFADGRHLKLFRGSRGLTVTLQGKNAVAAMFSRDGNQMVAIDGAVVSFDGNFDFFEWDGLVFITNLLTFESVTNIRQVTVQKAEEAIDAIQARFNLGENLAGLKTEIGKRTRLAKKLAAAHKHGLINDIDAQSLVERAQQKALRLGCRLHEGQAIFEIDHTDRGQVDDFVDLMTDLFLQSPVTRREWEAVVKRAPRERR